MTIFRTGSKILLVSGMSVMTLGCATDTGTGTLVGAGAGGVLGTMVGAATGHPLVGAALGAGTGALVGGAAGNASDAQKGAAQAQAAAVAAGPPMGISDVVELTRQGTREDIIINQIRNTRSTFYLRSEDFAYLQQNNVSPNVIATMQYYHPRYYYRYPPPPPPGFVRVGVGYPY